MAYKDGKRVGRITAQVDQGHLKLHKDDAGFFGFFAKALLLAMNWLHNVLSLPYGWAIIAITVIIKVIFWPLTQASTRSMKRMHA